MDTSFNGLSANIVEVYSHFTQFGFLGKYLFSSELIAIGLQRVCSAKCLPVTLSAQCRLVLKGYIALSHIRDAAHYVSINCITLLTAPL